MKYLMMIMLSVMLIGCNNPDDKFIISSSEMGVGGWILLGLGLLVFPVSIYFMKYHNKKESEQEK